MKKSAGILLYRNANTKIEFFLVHPGGPFFGKKDLGVWSIPKGEYLDEEPFEAALRELKEETGLYIEAAESISIFLKPVKQGTQKIITAYAIETDWDGENLQSNTFSLEWPPKSGSIQEFPEVDQGKWFPYQEALKKIVPAQSEFLKELLEILSI